MALEFASNITTVPLDGPDFPAHVNKSSSSTSLAERVISITWSSSITNVESTTTGASSTALTVIVAVAVLLSTVPSLALKVKLSSPFQSVVGT